MLHIILLILKIIGFLLLGIIALILILAAAVILSPFAYKADLSADNCVESIKGNIHFHWLLHLLEGHISYKDGKFEWQIRAAWKKFRSEDNSEDVLPTAHSSADEQPDSPESKAKSVLPAENKDDSLPQDKNKAHPSSVNNSAESTEESSGKSGISVKISRLCERFQKFKEKIKYTFRKMCDKIKTLKKKKDRIASFLQNTTHQNAFSCLIKEVRRLLRFLKPSKASVDLEFGFTDPAYTGYTLAWISLIYPMIGEYTQLKPDFEHKVFRGNIFVKGKIRILYALIFMWNMLWDKTVRITYRHLRKFRL